MPSAESLAAESLAIVGGGSWGTALACVLAPRFAEVRLWVLEPDLAERIESSRENDIFLPGIKLPPNVRAGSSLEPLVSGAPAVIGAMPSHAARTLYERILPFLDQSARLISATKGLETGSLMRISEVILEVTGGRFPVAVLSGPTFAREVAEGNPTALVIASSDRDFARHAQERLSGPTFRVYASDDPAGAEIGGALKNVIAIGAGICDGLGLGHNALAALVTRGLAELTRLAVALGAKPETLAGLAGMGDLVLTCTGDLSRNRQVGLKLAAGIALGKIVAATPMVAEGVRTTAVAIELAGRHGIEMPIAEQMHAVLNLGRSPSEAIRALMTRSLRYES